LTESSTLVKAPVPGVVRASRSPSPSTAPRAAGQPTDGVTLRRLPLVTHLGSLVAALVLIVQVDWHEWFFLDDWDTIVRRGLHHPAESIWYPHNEHWDTIPILVWRGLYSVFGLHQFWPYLLVVLLAHLALAHLIWRTCVFEGFNQWITTAFCALFAILGAGAENLVWASGIEFVWSLMLGYLALRLAARHRLWSRSRAAIALLVLASMMCSATGNIMAVAVAVVLVARGGWKEAVRVLWLPVAAFVAWFTLIGHQGLAANGDHISLNVITGIPDYTYTGLSGSLGKTFGLTSAGGALLVGVVAVVLLRFDALRRFHPVVLGTAVGGFAFFVLASLGRERYGLVNADSSRYIYVAIALLLPLVVYAADQLVRSQRMAQVPIYGLVAFMVVANYGLLRSFSSNFESMVRPEQQQILADATLLAEGVPSLPGPPVKYAPALTPERLRGLAQSHELPRLAMGTRQRLGAELHLDVQLSNQRLFKGRFLVLLLAQVSQSAVSNGCVRFTPTGPSPRFLIAPQPGGSSGQFTAGSYQPITVGLFSPPSRVGPSETLTLPKSGKIEVNVVTPPGVYPVLTFFPAQVSTLCGMVSPPTPLPARRAGSAATPPPAHLAPGRVRR
jgi:hypothetical protein